MLAFELIRAVDERVQKEFFNLQSLFALGVKRKKKRLPSLFALGVINNLDSGSKPDIVCNRPAADF